MDNPSSNTLTAKDSEQSEAERKKRARANAVQLQQRIALVVELLTVPLPVSRIKEECKKRFGVTGRRVEDYLSRARKLMIEQTKGATEYHLAESTLWYKSIIANDKLPLRERLMARKQLDEIRGLRAPRVVVNANTQNNLSVTNNADDSGSKSFLDQPLTAEWKKAFEAMTPESRKQFEASIEQSDRKGLSASPRLPG